MGDYIQLKSSISMKKTYTNIKVKSHTHVKLIMEMLKLYMYLKVGIQKKQQLLQMDLHNKNYMQLFQDYKLKIKKSLNKKNCQMILKITSLEKMKKKMKVRNLIEYLYM